MKKQLPKPAKKLVLARKTLKALTVKTHIRAGRVCSDVGSGCI